MKYKKKVKMIVLLLCLLVMAVSIYHICSYWQQEQASLCLIDDLMDKVEKPTDTQAATEESDMPKEAFPQETPKEVAPIVVDFEELWKENGDVVGWLYCPDTVINYPIVQGDDNDYYLRRLLDGSDNIAGTLFIDTRNTGDFSDWNTVVYGHNMHNGTMFGTLTEYNSQEYYNAHPVMYLLTPLQNYKIEIIAGYVTSFDSEIYDIKNTIKERDTIVQTALDKTGFTSEVVITDNDRIITLSTCSYEYENARYVLLGVLREIK